MKIWGSFSRRNHLDMYEFVPASLEMHLFYSDGRKKIEIGRKEGEKRRRKENGSKEVRMEEWREEKKK